MQDEHVSQINTWITKSREIQNTDTQHRFSQISHNITLLRLFWVWQHKTCRDHSRSDQSECLIFIWQLKWTLFYFETQGVCVWGHTSSIGGATVGQTVFSLPNTCKHKVVCKDVFKSHSGLLVYLALSECNLTAQGGIRQQVWTVPEAV